MTMHNSCISHSYVVAPYIIYNIVFKEDYIPMELELLSLYHKINNSRARHIHYDLWKMFNKYTKLIMN